jgi:hypothetical protein
MYYTFLLAQKEHASLSSTSNFYGNSGFERA